MHMFSVSVINIASKENCRACLIYYLFRLNNDIDDMYILYLKIKLHVVRPLWLLFIFMVVHWH